MSEFEPGLVHTPVTPFTRDSRIDYDTGTRMLTVAADSGAATRTQGTDDTDGHRRSSKMNLESESGFPIRLIGPISPTSQHLAHT